MFTQKLKNRFHRTLIGNILEGCGIKKNYERWLSKCKPMPDPNGIKQLAVKTFAQKYGIRVFIETGTYLGDMVAAVSCYFDRIYSIELSEDLFSQAIKKFGGYKHITIIHGDSFQVIPEILKHIYLPCLFWLNGHYSIGNTPKEKKEAFIMEELKQICAHRVKNHVILIDDACLFTGKNDYPTLEFLRTFVESRLSYYELDVKNDIIRIYKKL
jgi:hypothetical protein